MLTYFNFPAIHHVVPGMFKPGAAKIQTGEQPTGRVPWQGKLSTTATV
jgi:hypothetical protein